MITMAEDLPSNPGRSIVVGITVNLVSTQERDAPSEAEFARRLREVYGEPDLDELRSGRPRNRWIPRMVWIRPGQPPLGADFGRFRSLSLDDNALASEKEQERLHAWRVRRGEARPAAPPRL